MCFHQNQAEPKNSDGRFDDECSPEQFLDSPEKTAAEVMRRVHIRLLPRQLRSPWVPPKCGVWIMWGSILNGRSLR